MSPAARLVLVLCAASVMTCACSARYSRSEAIVGGNTVTQTTGGTGQSGSTGATSGTTGDGSTTGSVPGGTTSGGTTGGAGTTTGVGTSGGSSGSTSTSSGSTSGGGTSSSGGGPSAGPVDPGVKTGVTSTSIKIAYLIPKSGAGQVPPQVEDGIKAYWKALGNKLYGRTVTVTTYDTTSNSATAKSVAQQAVNDGNFLVAALDRLGVQGDIARTLDKLGVPNIEVQMPVGFPQDYKWTFDITMDHKVQGKMIADYFAHILKVKKIGVVYETDSTLQPGVDAFKAEAKAQGMQVVHSAQINGSDSQFLSEAQSLSNSKAEAVWLYMAPIPAVNIAQECDQQTYHPIWFGNSISWNFNLALGPAGKSMFGAKSFSPWPALDDPRAAFYVNSYAPSGGPAVQDLGLPGWGLGQVIANGLYNAGKDLGRNSFRNAMQHLQLTTTSPIDGHPLLWNPLSFSDGVRNGAGQLITYKQKGNASNTQWGSEANYRAGY